MIKIRILATVLFPIYAVAYTVAHLLKVEDRDNMPTFREWFGVE